MIASFGCAIETPVPPGPCTAIESSVTNDALPAAPAPCACMKPSPLSPMLAAYVLSSTLIVAPVSNRKSAGGAPLTDARSHTWRAA